MENPIKMDDLGHYFRKHPNDYDHHELQRACKLLSPGLPPVPRFWGRNLIPDIVDRKLLLTSLRVHV